jgi:hypothetical protein
LATARLPGGRHHRVPPGSMEVSILVNTGSDGVDLSLRGGTSAGDGGRLNGVPPVPLVVAPWPGLTGLAHPSPHVTPPGNRGGGAGMHKNPLFYPGVVLHTGILQ